jgi:hypothetical protein
LPCRPAASSPARAATITLKAVDNGWYNQLGDHVASNQNYFAGLNTPSNP